MNDLHHNKRIGIVSGVGPLAGSDVLSKVFAYAADSYGAHEDNEYPDVVLLNHGIDGVDNTASLNNHFKSEILDMIEQLDKWDCSIIGIACNTAHSFIDDATVGPKTQIVNLIDVVSQTAKQDNQKYGLLTSRGTRDQKLYHRYLEKYGVEFITATDEQQALLDKTIDKVMEHKAVEAGTYLQQVMDEMNEQGVHHFIAGCTELPIALQGVTTTDTVLDSNFLLAKALVDTYFAKS